MNRNQIANVVALIVAAIILAAAWIISPSGILSGIFSASLAVIFTLLIVKAIEKYQDERFTQILNLSARNGFVFLLFALPWTGALIAINLLAFDALAAVLSLWVSSIAVMYGSGAYYFRK
ncbi:MAG: hypothetical protein ACTSQZ_03680 [Candidatus Thorarchaeota archaeon]